LEDAPGSSGVCECDADAADTYDSDTNAAAYGGDEL